MRLRELTIRYAPLPVPLIRPVLTTPRDTAALLLPILDPEPTEVFGVLLLNTKHHVLAWTEIGRGGLRATIAEPREVFRAAILGNAATIILSHYVARHIMTIMCPASLCGPVVESRAS